MKNNVLHHYCSLKRVIISEWGTAATNLMYLTWMYLNLPTTTQRFHDRSIDLPVLKEQKAFLLVAKHRRLYKLEKHGWKSLIQHYPREMHLCWGTPSLIMDCKFIKYLKTIKTTNKGDCHQPKGLWNSLFRKHAPPKVHWKAELLQGLLLTSQEPIFRTMTFLIPFFSLWPHSSVPLCPFTYHLK